MNKRITQLNTNITSNHILMKLQSPAGLRKWGILAYLTNEGYRLKYALCSVNSLRCQIIVRRLKGGIKE